MINKIEEEKILKSISKQLKGQIYDELPKQMQWRVSVYSAAPKAENIERVYPVPNIVIGYIMREVICKEFTVFGIFDWYYTVVHVECFNPETPEEGWYEWFDNKGNDIDLFEVDENFNMYLQAFYAD